MKEAAFQKKLIKALSASGRYEVIKVRVANKVGVPDLFVYDTETARGVWVELKVNTHGGKVTQSQRRMLDRLDGVELRLVELDLGEPSLQCFTAEGALFGVALLPSLSATGVDAFVNMLIEAGDQ